MSVPAGVEPEVTERVDVDVDLNKALPCAGRELFNANTGEFVRREPCDNPATWAWTLECCERLTRLRCDECRAKVSADGEWMCSTCHAIHPGSGEWRRL